MASLSVRKLVSFVRERRMEPESGQKSGRLCSDQMNIVRQIRNQIKTRPKCLVFAWGGENRCIGSIHESAFFRCDF